MKGGWRGRFFEGFEIGDVYEHPLGQTVIAADNVWFTLLTQNRGRGRRESITGAATTSQPPQALASFLKNPRYKDLPDEVVGRTEEFLLNWVALGSVEGAGQPARDAGRRDET